MTAAQIRAACRFCHGKGCLNCDTLCDQEYKRQFPDGLPLLALFQRNDPEDRALLQTMFNKEGIDEASATGNPMAAGDVLVRKALEANRAQEVLRSAERETMP